MKKLKILEITAFSAGICGVWTRVLAESRLLSKKHEVYVFSSNIFRGGEEKKAKEYEVIDNVKIRRFKTKGSFGQNTYFWDFEKEALKLKPDVIISHAYRQYYSTKALSIAKKLNVPCFLVTHAPFLEKKLRGWKLNIAVFLYDFFIGRKILNDYKRIIAITAWEIPYLLELGLKKEKIVYIPNGIPEEFFKIKIKPKKHGNKKKLLFFGRIAPIKDLETLIKAVYRLNNKNIVLDIVGPYEQDYIKKLKYLIKNLNLENQIKFYPAVYDLRKKIEVLDSCDIFILPSKREGMPQALIEAMARGRIAISSKTDGGKEIISEGKNGFLFDIGNEKELADKIKKALEIKSQKISKNAKQFVRQFSWDILIRKIENLYVS